MLPLLVGIEEAAGHHRPGLAREGGRDPLSLGMPDLLIVDFTTNDLWESQDRTYSNKERPTQNATEQGPQLAAATEVMIRQLLTQFSDTAILAVCCLGSN